MKRRIAKLLVCCALAASLGGCVWLQNEFFVFDAAPVVVEPAPGTAAPH